MSWVLQGLQFLLTFIEVFLCYKVCDELVGEKSLFVNHKIYTYMCIIGMALFTSNNRTIGFFSDYEFYFRVIVVSLCIWITKRQNVVDIFCVVLNLFLTVALLDYLFLLLTLFFTYTDFMETIYRSVSIHRIIVFSFSRITVLGMCSKVIGKVIEKDISLYRNTLFLTGVLGCICLRRFQIAIVAFRADRKFWDSIFMTAFLISIAVIIVFYTRNIENKNKAELVKVKNHMLESNYNNLIQLYKKNQVFYHDYKNHLSVLNQYLKTSKYEKAEQYIESMLEPIRKKNDIIWEKSDIVNLVINLKSFEAEQKGIKFQIDIDDINWGKYDEKDLGVIFFNLLDNAIEACEKIKTLEKWIKITVKRLNEMIFIKVRNNVGEPITMVSGKFVTKKKDSSMHGIGIQSAKEVVEKNDGVLKMKYDDSIFWC